MLKNISQLISPELLQVLMEMGHGDELVLADGNFPAYSNTDRLINYYGVSVKELLDEILKYFPLDDFVDYDAILMESPDDELNIPGVWDRYQESFNKYNLKTDIKLLERKEFYERSRKAYAVVSTNDKTLYANIIIKKGVV